MIGDRRKNLASLADGYCIIKSMQTLTLTLPDTVQIDKRDVMMIVASKLYERAVLSMGQAAELAGISKREFIESLGDYGVSVFNYPASEIARDVRNA